MGKKYAADPNAPKRPPSAFFLFCGDHRDVVMKRHSNYSIGEVGKACGAAWARLTNAKKAPYQSKADKLSASYHKANDKYKATPGYHSYLEGKIAHKKAQKASDKRAELKAMLANKPARPHSAYMMYMLATRNKHKGSITEVAASVGKAWGNASASEKGKYEKKNAVAKAKYDKQMARYVQTDEYAKYEAAFNAHKTEVRKIKYYGSVAAANKAERTRLAARAAKAKAKAKAAKDRARKAAIRA